MPVWHLSISVWSKRGEHVVSVPKVAEAEAIKLLRGVGGDREWWIYRQESKVGHLRVAVTPEEFEQMPGGIAEHDAGDTGPERERVK